MSGDGQCGADPCQCGGQYFPGQRRASRDFARIVGRLCLKAAAQHPRCKGPNSGADQAKSHRDCAVIQRCRNEWNWGNKQDIGARAYWRNACFVERAAFVFARHAAIGAVFAAITLGHTFTVPQASRLPRQKARQSMRRRPAFALVSSFYTLPAVSLAAVQQQAKRAGRMRSGRAGFGRTCDEANEPGIWICSISVAMPIDGVLDVLTMQPVIMSPLCHFEQQLSRRWGRRNTCSRGSCGGIPLIAGRPLRG